MGTHRLNRADLAQGANVRIAGKLLGRTTQRRLVANDVSVAIQHGKAEARFGGLVIGRCAGARKRVGHLGELELGGRAQQSSVRCK
jgi:hypothetical protein